MKLENWDGSVITTPAKLERPRTVGEVVAIVKDSQTYPRPVRAVGSRHSVAGCMDADGGTIVDLTAMNCILEIYHDRVRVEAGALYIDIAQELERHGLQLHINTEIGNLTAGSAACCGTKDGAFTIDGDEEFGQVGSYVTAVKMVTASGEVVEISEEKDRDLMQVVRSSYGLLGIVVEVTLRVKPLQALAVEHRTYPLDRFLSELPRLRKQYQSLMLYILPFPRTVMVELRTYRPDLKPNRRWPWKLRNFAWATLAPIVAFLVTRGIPFKPLRYALLQWGGRLVQRVAPFLLRSQHTVPAAQMIRYPPRGDWRKYVFTFWAFPEASYPAVLSRYCDFCVDHYRRRGYRVNLFTVGYRVNRDDSSLLSYSFDGPVITIDPVSTGDEGWTEFLRAYNEFAVANGGIPLLNQTPELEAAHVSRAFDTRLDRLKKVRSEWDPDGRFLSGYFERLLS